MLLRALTVFTQRESVDSKVQHFEKSAEKDGLSYKGKDATKCSGSAVLDVLKNFVLSHTVGLACIKPEIEIKIVQCYGL